MVEDESMIGVVLVDDDALAREGLRDQIATQPDMHVVGAVSSWEEAADMLRGGEARVVMSEARLPGKGCADLLDELRCQAKPVGLLVLTRSEACDDALRLVQAGATAYLRKTTSPDELLAAVRTVASGGSVLDRRALEVVLEDYRSRCRSRRGGERTGDGTKTPKLTDREREVLTLVAEGRSTREIAVDLSLSQKTVEVHRSRIMDKLGLHKAAHLVRYALREGLVSLDPQ